LVLLAGPVHAADRPLVLETVVFRNEAAALEHFGRITRYLSERTGRRFKLVVAPDYLSASEDLRRGAADVAFLSPLLACKTRRWDPAIGYLATNRPSRGASPHYRAVIFARRTGGPADLAGAQGLALALVSEESAAGYHFPVARLLALGLHPETHFRKVYLLGTHQAVAAAVKGGSVPVGAVYEKALGAFGGSEEFRILEHTDPIPGSSLLTSPFLPARTVARLRDALVAPDYLDVVQQGGDADLPIAFPDFGWQAVDAEIMDAPCRTSATVREGLKRARSAGE